jgi:hypothetical protein
VTIVGPERFVGERALGWPGVLTVLARVGYRLISSRIRGLRYVLAGPSLTGGEGLPDVARIAAAGVSPPIDTGVPFELELMSRALRRAVAHQNHGHIVIQLQEAA